jgi:hypothetical protein
LIAPWVLPVIAPLHRIVLNILPDAVQRLIAADDVLVIVTLPNLAYSAVFPEPLRYTDFEAANDGTDCFRGST